MVRTPRVLITSLIAIGTPASGGRFSPRATDCIDAVGLSVGALGRKRQISVQFGVSALDAPVKLGGKLARGDFFASSAARTLATVQGVAALIA